jgi:hypothetical protein
MNLGVNYNSFSHLCNMVICVQLLVLNVKMNYVDHKLILGGSTQIHKCEHALINKGIKVFVSKKQHANIKIIIIIIIIIIIN